MTHRDISFTEPGHRRIGGLWLILDAEDRILVVNPNYGGKTGHYQLPGGSAAADEAPHLAAIREGREETGLSMIPDTLLITDYVTANKETGSVEGLNLVYLHRLRADDTIVLNTGSQEDPELLDFMFLADEELDKHCAPYQARRIRAAMGAAADPSTRGYRFEGQAIGNAA